jgi:hypothetical protein
MNQEMRRFVHDQHFGILMQDVELHRHLIRPGRIHSVSRNHAPAPLPQQAPAKRNLFPRGPAFVKFQL